MVLPLETVACRDGSAVNQNFLLMVSSSNSYLQTRFHWPASAFVTVLVEDWKD
jgi:hypothetical protein